MSTGTAAEVTPTPKKKKGKEKTAGWYTPHDKTVKRAATLLAQAKDPTRLSILLNLEENPLSVGQICEVTETSSQPAVSHHLALLRGANVVDCDRQGKQNIYSLTETGLLIVSLAKQVVDFS